MRFFNAVGVWIVTASLVSAAFGCRSAARVAPDRATVTARAADDSEIVAHERELWDSIRRGDRLAMDTLLAPEYRYWSSRGAQSGSKAEELAFEFGPRVRMQGYQLDHWQLARPGHDAVVLTTCRNATSCSTAGPRTPFKAPWPCGRGVASAGWRSRARSGGSHRKIF